MMLKDVNIFSDHMSLFTPKRKNDQFREGNTSFLAKSGKATCPVAITEKLVKLLPTSNHPRVPLVRRIIKSSSKECFHSCKGVSYSTLREEFKRHIALFVEDSSIYGTHSIKSGAASNPSVKISQKAYSISTQAGNVRRQKGDI